MDDAQYKAWKAEQEAQGFETRLYDMARRRLANRKSAERSKFRTHQQTNDEIQIWKQKARALEQQVQLLEQANKALQGQLSAATEQLNGAMGGQGQCADIDLEAGLTFDDTYLQGGEAGVGQSDDAVDDLDSLLDI